MGPTTWWVRRRDERSVGKAGPGGGRSRDGPVGVDVGVATGVADSGVGAVVGAGSGGTNRMGVGKDNGSAAGTGCDGDINVSNDVVATGGADVESVPGAGGGKARTDDAGAVVAGATAGVGTGMGAAGAGAGAAAAE